MEIAIKINAFIKVIKIGIFYNFLIVNCCKHTNEIEHFEKKNKKTIACTTIRTVYVSDILWFFDICTIFQFNKQTSKGSSLLCMNKIYLQVKLEL